MIPTHATQHAHNQTEIHVDNAEEAYLWFRYVCLHHDIPKDLFVEYVTKHVPHHSHEQVHGCIEGAWTTVSKTRRLLWCTRYKRSDV